MLKCHKVPRLPRKTTSQPILKPSTRRGFAAFPMDTAMAPESQRLERRHVGASKRTFRARLRQISRFAASKSTFSYKFSYGPTSKSTFRARLPSIFITCHKMPRVPRNLHLVTISCGADDAIRKKHATRHVESAALATRNNIGGLQSAASATKNATHLLKTLQKYCACHVKRLLKLLTRHET